MHCWNHKTVTTAPGGRDCHFCSEQIAVQLLLEDMHQHIPLVQKLEHFYH